MAVYKRGKIWWYKFVGNGESIRESTRQSNKRVAEQMEAAHRTSLAKGEVGIRDRKVVPTLKDFAERDFLPHVLVRFAQKPRTVEYYKTQVGHLVRHVPLAGAPVDSVTPGLIEGFVAVQREAKYKVSSTNRALQVLRRMLRVAVLWEKTDKAPPQVSLMPGEERRERVLTAAEEAAYLKAAQAVGDKKLEAYQRALNGVRSTHRGQPPTKPKDPYLLRDVGTVLLSCALRPDECYELKWEHYRDGALHIPSGKTKNARRSIPVSERVRAVLDMRRSVSLSEWVFPAPTASGHIEQSSLKKQHRKACVLAGLECIVFYTFRHTCLTRWAKYMDPYTLSYYAGHASFVTTRRYVHPNMETGRAAMERADQVQGGHNPGHSDVGVEGPLDAGLT